MWEQGLNGAPWIRACCGNAIGQPCPGRPDMLGAAYRHRRGPRAPRAQQTGTSGGLCSRQRFWHTLVWKHGMGRSQRPPRCLRLPAQSAPWHRAHFLTAKVRTAISKIVRSASIRRTQFRSLRPRETRIHCHGAVVHRGDDHAAPQALFFGDARRLDHSSAGSTASPSEATPSRQLRDTTEF
jgi:hypothetical protein